MKIKVGDKVSFSEQTYIVVNVDSSRHDRTYIQINSSNLLEAIQWFDLKMFTIVPNDSVWEVQMSEFEEIFGEDTNMNEDLSSFIATIRDNFPDKINHYIPENSMASSPSCVLFAVYKLLENDLKEKEYSPYEVLKKCT